ncbi:MAG: DUF302 domain-containing protein [Candidatus Omnitrophica bacterium]|nr:DUF302 domain-containing protein [Candidatus Omnitrophota bacterium]
MRTEKMALIVRTGVRVGFVAVALVALVTASARAQDPDRVDKVSKSSFSTTLKSVEAALKAEHMMIVARVDHKNMLSMVGAKIKGATTIEFGKPDMGKMLLPMNAAIGLEMPGKIYVYESADGKVIVSYRKSAKQFATYGSDVGKAGEMMDMMLDKITSAATQ